MALKRHGMHICAVSFAPDSAVILGADGAPLHICAEQTGERYESGPRGLSLNGMNSALFLNYKCTRWIFFSLMSNYKILFYLLPAIKEKLFTHHLTVPVNLAQIILEEAADSGFSFP